MDYFAVIKKAFNITFKYKFLWALGILMAGAGGMGFITPSSPATSSPSLSQEESDQFLQAMTTVWQNYSSFIAAGLGLILLITLIFLVLNIISQGAMIGSIDKIDKQEKTDFYIGFKIGTKNFWRVFGVSLLYFLMIFASLCVLVIPVVLALIDGSIAVALTWGILMLVLCGIFWFLTNLIAPYSIIVAVLEKHSVWESIRESLHFFQKKWPQIIIMYLILLAIAIAYGIALVMVFGLIVAIIFLLGMAFWMASSFAAIVYGILMALALIAVFVVINGAFKAFLMASMVLTYNRLRK